MTGGTFIISSKDTKQPATPYSSLEPQQNKRKRYPTY